MKILNTSFLMIMIFALISGFNLNSNTDSSSAFVEIESNKKSDALFATLAIQLTDQNGGYDRAIATLTELIKAARDQAFQNNLTWRKTEELCTVSKYKLNERQEFFDGNLNNYVKERLETDQINAESKDLISFKEKSVSAYKEILEREKTLHSNENAKLKSVVELLEEGVKRTDIAISAVQNWTTEVQNNDVVNKINDVTYTYKKVNNFKVVIPASVLREGYKNSQVRHRILAWLGQLKVLFYDQMNQYVQIAKNRAHLGKAIENEIIDIAAYLQKEVKHLKKNVGNYKNIIEDLSKNKENYDMLSAKNRDLIDANNEYCRDEQESYLKLKADFEDSVELYSKIRLYFKENYANIKEFLKNKYRNIQ